MTSASRFNPFPGLRTFEPNEEHLFFGRERQIDELLVRLGRTRFLAIVGTSGCGKSSLIPSGLVPSLHSGFMAKAGSSWRVALFRPGGDPIGTMKNALSQHAEEAYAELGTDRSRQIAERMFKALTELNPEAGGVRRPCRVEELGGIAEATSGEVIEVVDRFRAWVSGILKGPPCTPPKPYVSDRTTRLSTIWRVSRTLPRRNSSRPSSTFGKLLRSTPISSRRATTSPRQRG